MVLSLYFLMPTLEIVYETVVDMTAFVHMSFSLSSSLWDLSY